MSDLVLVVLGVVVLGVAILVFSSFWTVQIMVVPIVIAVGLFVVLLRTPVTRDEAGPRDPNAKR
jgi:ABC-type transport system involved in cytochrome c biogenesis permease subunit